MERMVKNFSWALTEIGDYFGWSVGNFSHGTASSAPLCSWHSADDLPSHCPLCSQSFMPRRLTWALHPASPQRQASLPATFLGSGQKRLAFTEFSLRSSGRCYIRPVLQIRLTNRWSKGPGHTSFQQSLRSIPPSHGYPASEMMCKLLHRGRCYLLYINFFCSYSSLSHSCLCKINPYVIYALDRTLQQTLLPSYTGGCGFKLTSRYSLTTLMNSLFKKLRY